MATTFTYPQIAVQLSGGATLAEQQAQTSKLTSIDNKTPTLGQALMAASQPVTIASNQSAVPISASSLPLPAGAATETTLAALNTKVPAQGQALMASSLPVTIASNQSTLPVSAASLPLPTGAATSALQSTIDASINTLLKPASTLAAVTSITNTVTIKADTAVNQTNALKVDGTATTQPISAASLPLPTGAATQTTLAALLTELQLKADLTETQPVQAARSTTATLANVISSVTSVTLQASNVNRKGLAIFNDSAAVLYVKFGATASTTSYTVQIGAGGYYELPQPCYTGVVDGIWASANGNARITEW